MHLLFCISSSDDVEGEDDSSTEADVSTDESAEESLAKRSGRQQSRVPNEANKLDFFRNRDLASPDGDCERMCLQPNDTSFCRPQTIPAATTTTMWHALPSESLLFAKYVLL